ncbi:MAG: DUF4302 domain-containing protein [Capnocytophaga sp.]|nr:DUF4302 domain-containing protein [Capnocytophaga sp.]
MKKLIFLSAFATLIACQSNEDEVFNKSAAERVEQAQNELRSELSSSEHGWKLTYFSDDKTFGAYNFLMKFTENGFVEMVSDWDSNSLTPETSKYEISQAQGVSLIFSTKNHLHNLSDGYLDRDIFKGKGLKGEFIFIYYGKEGDKLKFKTERGKKEKFIYFEKATSEDWSAIQNYSQDFTKINQLPFNYYFRTTTSEGVQDYDMSISDYRFLTLTSFSDPTKQIKAGIGHTLTSIVFSPSLVIEGKSFTELTLQNTSPKTYKSTIDGVTAEIAYSAQPMEEHLTNDYMQFEPTTPRGVGRIFIFTQYLKNVYHMSENFYNTILKIDDNKDFGRFEIDFDDAELYASIGYEFEKDGEKIGASLATTYTYEVKDKLLFFKEKGSSVESSDDDLWNAPENSLILQKANAALNQIGELGSEGFYIKKLNLRYSFVNLDVFLLQSKKYPNTYFPAYTFYKVQ